MTSLIFIQPKQRIIFRADGGSLTGLGHVTRSLALAQMLREAYECVFAIQSPDAALREQILKTCHGLIELPVCGATDERFIHELHAYVSEEEIVVLDGYSFNTAYQKNIKAKGAALVCIDDIHSYDFVADAIINQAGGIDAANYTIAPYTKLYLGPKYALLREPFLKAARTDVRLNTNTSRILLCMGGADPDNYTLRIAAEVQQLQKDLILEIIVGSAYKHLTPLHSWLKKNPEHRLHTNLDADSMCELMKQCPSAITSASGIAYEYASVGGVLFIKQTAENQSGLYQYLLSSKLALDYSALKENSNNDKLPVTITELYKNQKAVFDGQSPKRLNEIFSGLKMQTSLKLREVEPEDMPLLFNWANDPEVRKHSFNSAPIPLEIHTGWFNTKLDNPDSILYIAEVQGVPAAHIRFEIADNTAIISYLISKEFRGRGLGHTVLHKGVHQLLAQRKDVRLIEGLVQKENAASVRAFEKAGFTPAAQDAEHPNALRFTLPVHYN